MGTYPSVSMLPIAEIKQMLLTEEFKATFGASNDTLHVGNVPAKNIAQAVPTNYTDNTDITSRDTVKNALYLNGIPAENYMRIDQNNTLVNQTQAATTIQRDDTLILRDETYRFYAQLVRQGLIKDEGVRYGFQDNFIESKLNYLENNTCAVHDSMLLQLPIHTIIPALSGFINAGEFFIAAVFKIVDNTYSRSFLLKAQTVTVSNGLDNITFSELNEDTPFTLEALSADETLRLFKVQGTYSNYNFSFSSLETDNNNVETYTSSLLDYYTPTTASLDATTIGYASTLTIHEDLLGFNEAGLLKSFSVALKRVGTPGGLRCYVLKNTNLNDIHSIASLLQNKQLVAYSDYITPDDVPIAITKFVNFPLRTPEGKAFSVQADTTYLFVVAAEMCDKLNTWELRFGEGQNGDLQTNRTCYSFVEGEGLKILLNKGDLICCVITSDLPHLTLSPYTNGLYTSKTFEIYAQNLNKARLSLRVKKENTYVTNNVTPQFITQGKRIKLLGDISLSTFNEGDKVIIGHSVSTVASVTIQSSIYISLTDNIFLEPNASVYKVNYYPNLILNYQDLNQPDTSATYALPLQLVGCQPCVHENLSDILFFECTLPQTFLTLISGNIQVGWRTERSNCEGAINNLSLAFAQGYVEEINS